MSLFLHIVNSFKFINIQFVKKRENSRRNLMCMQKDRIQNFFQFSNKSIRDHHKNKALVQKSSIDVWNTGGNRN